MLLPDHGLYLWSDCSNNWTFFWSKVVIFSYLSKHFNSDFLSEFEFPNGSESDLKMWYMCLSSLPHCHGLYVCRAGIGEEWGAAMYPKVQSPWAFCPPPPFWNKIITKPVQLCYYKYYYRSCYGRNTMNNFDEYWQIFTAFSQTNKNPLIRSEVGRMRLYLPSSHVIILSVKMQAVSEDYHLHTNSNFAINGNSDLHQNLFYFWDNYRLQEFYDSST